ncbi:MAG: hypothetical protein Cons2KO_18720 [Congregibacter sp.]
MADVMKQVEAYLEIAFEYPAHYQLMFEASTRGYSPSGATIEEAAITFGVLLDVLRRLPYLSIDVEMAATELLSLTHGLITFGIHPSYGILRDRDWRVSILNACHAHMEARASRSVG